MTRKQYQQLKEWSADANPVEESRTIRALEKAKKEMDRLSRA